MQTPCATFTRVFGTCQSGVSCVGLRKEKRFRMRAIVIRSSAVSSISCFLFSLIQSTLHKTYSMADDPSKVSRQLFSGLDPADSGDRLSLTTPPRRPFFEASDRECCVIEYVLNRNRPNRLLVDESPSDDNSVAIMHPNTMETLGLFRQVISARIRRSGLTKSEAILS